MKNSAEWRDNPNLRLLYDEMVNENAKVVLEQEQEIKRLTAENERLNDLLEKLKAQ